MARQACGAAGHSNVLIVLKGTDYNVEALFPTGRRGMELDPKHRLRVRLGYEWRGCLCSWMHPRS